MDNIQVKAQRGKKRNRMNKRNMGSNQKIQNLQLVSGREETLRQKEMFEQIIVKNIQKLMKTVNPQIQEAP